MSHSPLQIEDRDAVRVVTVNRPDKLNALDSATLDALHEAFEAAAEDRAVRAIVLTGAAVRLTGSGLGCSDWPRCEQDRFVAPVEYHAMIEFGNRLVSFVVVATVALVIWGALRRVPYRRDLLTPGVWIAVFTAVQIILGGITVLRRIEDGGARHEEQAADYDE